MNTPIPTPPRKDTTSANGRFPRAIILHGMPDKKEYYDLNGDSQSNSHWLPWLQQQLCARGIQAQTPELPTPYEPVYEEWLEEFERYQPEKANLLVGHSCGGGFLLRWLSEKSEAIPAKVVLVAPWIDVEKEYRPFFDFVLPHTLARQAGGGVELVASTDDADDIQQSVAYIQRRVENIKIHEFRNYGHFTLEAMKRRDFPGLLDICLGTPI